MGFSKLNKKVYYHDTDCGGVVYYANYLKYFEEGRTELLSEKGIDIKELADKGIFFVVRNVSLDYKAPARYGDNLEVLTNIEEVKKTSIIFYQEVKKGDIVLVSGRAVLVCVNTGFKPIAIHESLKAKL